MCQVQILFAVGGDGCRVLRFFRELLSVILLLSSWGICYLVGFGYVYREILVDLLKVYAGSEILRDVIGGIVGLDQASIFSKISSSEKGLGR